jgi:hypothetical protein
MTTQRGRVDSKNCPACGGTWPADRRNCLACGANLESVPARPGSEETGREPLDWSWLDAMGDEGTAREASNAAGDEGKPGCLARLLPGRR